jgi:hypothetical protein
MVNYETLEQKRLFWMIIERDHDPTQSVFKNIKKIMKRKGKMTIKIQLLVRHLVNIKLSSELNYTEFE